jgi:hypothetical protein
MTTKSNFAEKPQERRMPKSVLLLGVAIAGLTWPGLAESQSASGQKIPDFSVGWARIGDMVETFEPVAGASAGPITIDPKFPRVQGGVGDELRWVADLSNPILKPDTRAKLKFIVDNEIIGIPHIKDEGMCMPSGVPMLHNRRGGAIQLLQTPTQITILNARDHQVRFIYLNVPHSKTLPKGNGWYGESVGHYEGGDTLVVDTIGQNDKTQIDRFGTTHSDKIHVVERFQISPDGRNMTVTFTVDDPGAFTMPWTGQARFRRATGDWDEQICAENNRFVGRITVHGQVLNDAVPMPVDDTPDF